MSIAKIHLLEQAKASFQAATLSVAAAAFPTKIDRPPTQFSLALGESAINSNYKPTENTSSLLDDGSSVSSDDSSITPANRKELEPLPLRIRNAGGSTNDNYAEEVRIGRSSILAPTVSQTTPTKPGSRSLSTSRPTSIIFSESTTTWLHNRIQERYGTLLFDFSDTLAKYISDIDDLIRTAQEAQAARYTVKKLARYGEDEGEERKQTDLNIRIARLKADGWKRQRFAPERYQELCAVALAEL